MAIHIFPPTLAGQTEAFAVSDPKNVVFNQKHFIVSDGADYVAPPVPSADEADREAARAYAKLTALKSMTPAQIKTHVASVFGSLTQAQQDDLSAIAVAVGILARNM